MALFATPDDYKNFFGQDLANVLRGWDNDSNYPNIFMGLVQDFLIDWCQENGFVVMRPENFSPVQREAFKKACLYQAYYTTKNGLAALGLDSGYDAERLQFASRTDLKSVELPSRVISLLHTSGLFNLKIRNRPRFTRGYPYLGTNYGGGF